MKWLLASSIAARLPASMLLLGLLLVVRARFGSASAPGLALGAFGLANAVSTPVQSALVDRLGQVRVLVPFALVHATVVGLFVAATADRMSLGVVFVLAAVAGTSYPPVSAGTRAVWPHVIADIHERETIYAIDSASVEIVWTVGPLIVGGIVALASAEVAVACAAALTVIATAAYVATPAARAWKPEGGPRSRAGALASGGLRTLLWSELLVGICWGAVTVGLPTIAVKHHEAALAGVMLAALSAGSVIGGVFYGARSWSLPTSARYPLLLALIGGVTAPLIASGASVPISVVVAIVAGTCWAPTMSCQFTLTGRLAPAGTLAEAFGWSWSALVTGVSLGSFGAGAVAPIGIGAPFALGCVFIAGACAFAFAGRVSLAVADPRPARAGACAVEGP